MNKQEVKHSVQDLLDKIKEIKGMLKNFNGYKLQNYEISVDYDENGYVNKVTIESK